MLSPRHIVTPLLPAACIHTRYDECADPYRAHDPYRAAAPAAAYAAPAAGTAAYAAPAAYGAATDQTAAAAAAAGGQQLMYILQDGVLKPLTVMYQQQGAAAAPQVVPGYGTTSGAQAAYTTATTSTAAPTSAGGTAAVLYQQPAAATYTYAAAPTAAPASAGTGTDAAGTAAASAGGWVGAVQQLVGQVATSSAPLTVGSYPAAATVSLTGLGYMCGLTCRGLLMFHHHMLPWTQQTSCIWSSGSVGGLNSLGLTWVMQHDSSRVLQPVMDMQCITPYFCFSCWIKWLAYHRVVCHAGPDSSAVHCASRHTVRTVHLPSAVKHCMPVMMQDVTCQVRQGYRQGRLLQTAVCKAMLTCWQHQQQPTAAKALRT